jgi:hypothetical protein
MTDRTGVEIDYCPSCRGIWLDRGELDKIIERSYAAAPPDEGQRFDRPDDRREDHHHDKHDSHRDKHDNHHDRPGKHRSWLHDLFD